MKRACFLGFVLAAMLFTPSGTPMAADDITAHGSCHYCGMDRQKFAHSRMLIVYEDDSEMGTCSLHCAALDMALNIDKLPRSILVADMNTRRLIDAEKAFWTIGGDTPGVMTRRAKWAFENQSDADAYAKAHGAATATFEGAMRAAYEDMYADTRMIRGKRQKMREKAAAAAAMPPKPSEKDKCPVCGMFVAKYPQWVGVIVLKDRKPFYFDGAKDLFKFHFDPAAFAPDVSGDQITAAYVTEYYDLKLIPAEKAWYVSGSDVFGPMGKELIPFARKEDAETFMKDHQGEELLTFEQVTVEKVQRLDQ